jgi:hypothetical protein
MAMKRHGVFAAFLALALAGTGCLTVADDEGPILSVELYWDEEPNNDFVGGTCETAGVDEMEWRLLDENGGEVETNISTSRDSTHPCYNAIDILGLEPGTYRLEILGYENVYDDENRLIEQRLRWQETSGKLSVLRFDVMYAFDIPEE